MHFSKQYSKTPPPSVIVGIAALILGGVGLLFFLSFVKFKGPEIAWEFFRELGVALVVSGVVAGLFELYRSIRHHVQTMRDVIDITMGEQITPEVWLELKGLIEARKVIRRNAHLRWSLVRNSTLRENEAILQLEYEYEVHALTNKGFEFQIEHELDYHMCNEQLFLPRFERVVIDPPGAEAETLDGERLKAASGKIKFPVMLQGRGGDPVHVRLERTELVNVPGSYNLYTPEFIKGLYLHYGECPGDVEPEVLVRPLGPGLILKHVGNSWSCEHLLLPGQGIEIKFSHKPSQLDLLTSNKSGDQQLSAAPG